MKAIDARASSFDPAEAKDTTITLKERISAHFAIARLDHSIKNLFVLPGVIIPLSIYPALLNKALIWRFLLAFVSITLVACSNYVINEVLDAPFDRLHPTKKNRAAARGHVVTSLAYVQWLLMMVVGVWVMCPCQTTPGFASQVILTGCPIARRPISGSSK